MGAIPLCRMDKTDRKCVYFTGSTRSNLPFIPSFQLTIIFNYVLLHTSFNVSWIAKIFRKKVQKLILSLSHASTLATKPLNCVPFCLSGGHGSSISLCSVTVFEQVRWCLPSLGSARTFWRPGTSCSPRSSSSLEGCCISEIEVK